MILARLQETCGDDGYHYMMPVSDTSMLPFDEGNMTDELFDQLDFDDDVEHLDVDDDFGDGVLDDGQVARIRVVDPGRS